MSHYQNILPYKVQNYTKITRNDLQIFSLLLKRHLLQSAYFDLNISEFYFPGIGSMLYHELIPETNKIELGFNCHKTAEAAVALSDDSGIFNLNGIECHIGNPETVLSRCGLRALKFAYYSLGELHAHYMAKLEQIKDPCEYAKIIHYLKLIKEEELLPLTTYKERK